MFTGIIETLGLVIAIEKDGSNCTYTIESDMSSALKVDQSVAHDGVCLTVIWVEGNQHKVTAIQETLEKSNLRSWAVGRKVNLERAMVMGARLDGHIVQGHVDTLGKCIFIQEVSGSWYYTFQFPVEYAGLMVDKGSICVSGVSLTVVSPTDQQFSVAIIPYTYEHTVFHQMRLGDAINLEFDILGKYVQRLLGQSNLKNSIT